MNYKLLVVALCALMLSSTSVVWAESGSDSGSSIDDDSSSNSSETRSVSPDDVRNRMRVRYEERGPDGQRIKEEFRQDIRDGQIKDMRIKMEERGPDGQLIRQEMRLSSSTRGEIKDMRIETREKIGDMRDDAKMRIKSASSSMERREIRTNLRKDVFQAHQDRLVGQLNLALENLKQIRTRISARIDKAEASGRTMTDAKALLVIADAKIATAASEIAALGAFVPPAATSSLTSAADDASAEVELEKPRQIAEKAIKAVKDARKALVDVTIAIAKNMGIRCSAEGESLRCQSNATSTPPTTTPPTETATTTP